MDARGHAASAGRRARKRLATGSVVVLAAATALAAAGTAEAAAPVRAGRGPLIGVHAPRTAFHDSQSNNWSGYNEGILDTGSPFTSISARWVVPTATQHTTGQAEDSATWIGIGGGCLSTTCTATDPTLVQAGTDQDVSSNGTASYSAWWEILPLPSVTATIAVHPGDVIDCSIAETVPGIWSISLEDKTDGQRFTETVPYVSTEDTAEWIEETPVVIGTGPAGVSALPDLSTVSFSDATANGADAALVPADAIQLVGSNG
ncbi:MAG: G1 family glutamic endopeptidase, partial [Acidimicrobiales bacterium]